MSGFSESEATAVLFNNQPPIFAEYIREYF
jgi:hypothetical protein